MQRTKSAVFILALAILWATNLALGAADEPRGQIFVRVFARKDDGFEAFILAADPATGKWQRLIDGERLFAVRLSRLTAAGVRHAQLRL